MKKILIFLSLTFITLSTLGQLKPIDFNEIKRIAQSSDESLTPSLS